MKEPLSQKELINGTGMFRAIIEQSSVAIVVVNDDGAIGYVNESAGSLLGLVIENNPDRSDFSVTESALSESEWDNSELPDCFDDLAPGRYETRRLKTPDGKRIWLEVSTQQIESDGEQLQVYFARDVSTNKDREFELERAANTDSLSGLVNRREFQSVLEAAVDDPVCFAIVDVDWFKKINDGYGHLFGDEAIVEISARLSECFPDSLCIARLGGDEFGVLLKNAGDGGERVAFETFCAKVASAPFSALAIPLTVSIGVAVTNGATSSRELLTCADTAMYEAKDSGRNRVVVRCVV